MKTVFSNAMVAHVWAQQSQPHGRSGNGNFSFEGNTLNSYRTPIACILTTAHGRVMLLTSHKYSPTTEGKHKHAARDAWQHLGEVFVVPSLQEHRANAAWLLKQYRDFAASRLRANRSYYTEADELATFQAVANMVRNYCAAFDLDAPSIEHEADGAKAWARFARLAAQRATPEWQAQQAKAAERREKLATAKAESARLALYSRLQDHFVQYMTEENSVYACSYWSFPKGAPERTFLENAAEERDQALGREWHALFDAWRTGTGPLPEKGLLGEHHARLSEEEASLWKAACNARDLARNAERIAAWRTGLGPSSLYSLGVTLLRIRGDNIETSRGAVFPLSHGTRAWPFILAARGKGWKRNGHSIHLGHFQIDEILPEGDVVAGCHHVAFAEIEAIAHALNLI